MYYELTDQFIVRADMQKAAEFFGNALNLPLITPPWMHFTIAMKDVPKIEEETLLDYTIRWLGIPIRWRTKIIQWDMPRQFIDLQIRGPYVLWHHHHRFEERAEGTFCSDRVIYKLPVPGISRVVHALVVRRQLMEVFNYRRKVIGEKLGWVREEQQGVQIRAL